jgi:heptosyltransferase-2
MAEEWSLPSPTWAIGNSTLRLPSSVTRFGTVYQALRNPHLDELINRDRRRLGVETFDRKKGFQAALALLRAPGSVGVLVDQSAGHGGIWMPFFNRLCSTSPLAATLAIRTNAAVIPSAVYTSGFAKWRVVFEEEVPYDPANPEQLTADINAVLERQIRQSPADWFWVHNRWKTPWPHLLIGKQKRGTYLPPGTNGSQLFPYRFLVRSPNWLGDAVMSQNTVRAFKDGRPDARLSVPTPAKLEAFWKSISEVDEVIPFAEAESVLAIAGRLRGRFDAAILLPNSFRSAAEAWLPAIPRRVGFRGHFRSTLLTQIIDEPQKKKAAPPKHHADRYWHMEQTRRLQLRFITRRGAKALLSEFVQEQSMDRPSAGQQIAFAKPWNSFPVRSPARGLLWGCRATAA